MDDLGDVAALAAAASAIAAWLSAHASRQGVSRANASFVWPAIRIGSAEPGPRTFYIRLHNDGPGITFDVRCTTQADWGAEFAYVTPPVRAMRSGEVVPPHPEPQEQPTTRDDNEYALAAPRDLREPTYVTVRFDDGFGRRWEVRAPLHPHGRIALRGCARSALISLLRS
ncbi:MAG TPA: hypothetical protein VHF45_07550 [Thermoleophilaceae bacterium]|nr:hypothetical protein [Thermoleophilaceae bacterium]